MENIVVRWAQLMIQPAQLKIVAATIAVLIFLHGLFKHFFHQHTKLKRVPGPFPWPVVGNLLTLGKLPHRALYKLSKKYGDIMELKLGSVLTIVVSSPEMAKQVLKDHDLICASRPETIASKIMFEQRDIGWAPYGDHWRHMRKLSTLELLTLKRLEDSKNVRDEELSWLVHGIFEHCKVNVLFHNFNFCFFSLHFKCCMNMIPKLEKGSKLINITIEIVGCIALSLSFNPSFGTNIFKFGLDTRLIEFK